MKHPLSSTAFLAVLSALIASGCAVEPPPASGTAAAGTASSPLSPKSPVASGGAVFANQVPSSAAPAPNRLRVVQLDVYHLEVPLGAISRSEEFWKHVDEQAIDIGTYDLLRKNGWRVGIAPSNEWGYFRDIIDAYPASSKPHGITTGTTGGGGHMELPMKEGVPYQVLWYFNDYNQLHGFSFERCDNLLNISLHQVPRRPGEARVTVCPTVRSLRKRYEVTRRNEEREIRYIHPERLYNLNLQVDIPINHFLVIAPSPEVKFKSLGATFLVRDGHAEQAEYVLLMVPRAAELEETTPVSP